MALSKCIEKLKAQMEKVRPHLKRGYKGESSKASSQVHYHVQQCP